MAFVPIYILILGFTIAIDYTAGIMIENASGKRRNLFLIMSLIANIGMLAIFKYYNFITENFNFLLHGFSPSHQLPYLKILLPLGLSFHTFQAMSYTIEVYRGNQKAERHFGIYSLYVMFYPQLVAGPIERPQNLLHQFREKFHFDYDRIISGLQLMGWGLFKKVVIADRLAVVVDFVYRSPYSHNSLSLITATIFFAFQLFCDFSGYSDIAIGAARVMGFKLMTNFRSPYQSKSISEYWTRWHISLSTWFKDYILNPLGHKRDKGRMYLNIMIVFLISGLWHGSNWTFLLCGIIQGFYIVFGHITKKIRMRINKKLLLDKLPLLSILTTFGLVCFVYIFFRSDNLTTGFYIATHIFTGLPIIVSKLLHHQSIFEYLGTSKANLYLSFLLIIFIESIHFFQERINIEEYFNARPIYLRWAVYFAAIGIIFLFGVFENRQFIYFQF